MQSSQLAELAEVAQLAQLARLAEVAAVEVHSVRSVRSTSPSSRASARRKAWPHRRGRPPMISKDSPKEAYHSLKEPEVQASLGRMPGEADL